MFYVFLLIVYSLFEFRVWMLAGLVLYWLFRVFSVLFSDRQDETFNVN